MPPCATSCRARLFCLIRRCVPVYRVHLLLQHPRLSCHTAATRWHGPEPHVLRLHVVGIMPTFRAGEADGLIRSAVSANGAVVRRQVRHQAQPGGSMVRRTSCSRGPWRVGGRGAQHGPGARAACHWRWSGSCRRDADSRTGPGRRAAGNPLVVRPPRVRSAPSEPTNLPDPRVRLPLCSSCGYR
jgi:hypothetical protein